MCIRDRGENCNLMSTWTRPSRVTDDDKEHGYAVQRLVTAKRHDVHVARMRFYADDQLEITCELLKFFQQLENLEEHHIWSISAIKQAAGGDDFAF